MEIKSKPRVSARAKKLGQPRKFSYEFRAQALERMKSCDNVTALAQASGASVRPKPLAAERELQRIVELRRKRERTSGAASPSKSGT